MCGGLRRGGVIAVLRRVSLDAHVRLILAVAFYQLGPSCIGLDRFVDALQLCLLTLQLVVQVLSLCAQVADFSVANFRSCMQHISFMN